MDDSRSPVLLAHLEPLRSATSRELPPRRGHVWQAHAKNRRWERLTNHEVASAQLARRGEARVADHVAHHAWPFFRGIATAAQPVVRNRCAAGGTAFAVMRADRPPTMRGSQGSRAEGASWAAGRRRNRDLLPPRSVAEQAPAPDQGGPLRGDRPNAAAETLKPRATLTAGFRGRAIAAGKALPAACGLPRG